MPARRKYHLLVYERGSDAPTWFATNPFYWYPSFETAHKAAHRFASEHDHCVRVDVLHDGDVVERVRACDD